MAHPRRSDEARRIGELVAGTLRVVGAERIAARVARAMADAVAALARREGFANP